MAEKEIFRVSQIPEDNLQIASVRSNIYNSPLIPFLEHTIFDHYQSNSGYRVKSILYSRCKMCPVLKEMKLTAEEKEKTIKQTRKGVILRIEHNQRGDFFFVKIKSGSGAEFHYISRAAEVDENGKREVTIVKDHKGERYYDPEGVNKRLIFAMHHSFNKVNRGK